MALVVENGSGLVDAEAYASVSEADTYNSLHTADATWDALSTADKEIKLRIATQYLDAKYNANWQGMSRTGTQALDWPRYNVEVNGHSLDSTVLPQRLKDGCMSLAIDAASDAALFTNETTPGTVEEYAIEADGVKERTRYMGGRSQQTKYTLVHSILLPLMQGNRAVRV